MDRRGIARPVGFVVGADGDARRAHPDCRRLPSPNRRPSRNSPARPTARLQHLQPVSPEGQSAAEGKGRAAGGQRHVPAVDRLVLPHRLVARLTIVHPTSRQSGSCRTSRIWTGIAMRCPSGADRDDAEAGLPRLHSPCRPEKSSAMPMSGVAAAAPGIVVSASTPRPAGSFTVAESCTCKRAAAIGQRREIDRQRSSVPAHPSVSARSTCVSLAR